MVNSKTFAALGVADLKSYFLKYFLPIFLLDFLILFVFLFAFPSGTAKIIGIILFFGILITLFAYPSIIIDNQSRDIEENLHYFITYAGALSTVNLERKELFVDLSEKTRYKEISKIFKKLIYLVDSIKVDFSTAAYKTATLLNTEHFSRFLERMGIALSFNSNISKFFLDEQKALMNSYEVVYRESLERIKSVQDMFISLVLAFSFVLATILLMPFLTGIDSTVFLKFGILGMFIVDMMMIVFIKFFLPKDQLYHSMGYEEGRKKVLYLFFISLLLVLILIPIVIFLNIAAMLKVAIISTPLLIVGMYANYQEKLVWKRDILFPPFVRSLGDVHQSKGGTLTTTVETLLPHNFGILNDMLERVYKRLKITGDKFNSWMFFTKESGSALIAEFMDIFVTVVYRGGSSQVAGEIVSDNMSKINGLRDQKREFASSLKGNIYGTYFGLALTIYISLLISVLLFKIFASLTDGLDGVALDLIGGIFPTGLEDNFLESTYYVAAILTIHALISGYFLKDVDGGNKFSMFTDVVIMLWIGAILEIVLTLMFKGMFSSYFGT
jgi:archaellum biogenesis protein FlaJ (TadC family)